MNQLDNARIDHMVETYQGTCRLLSDDDRDFLESDSEFGNEFDQWIFNCEYCGWWCEIHEDTGNGICEECTT